MTSDFENVVEEKESCCICLSPRNMEQQQCPHCKKKFHLTCLIQWLNESRTCPMCRKEIKKIKLSDKIFNFNIDVLNYEENLLNADNRCNINCEYFYKWCCTLFLCILIFSLMIMLVASKL